MSVSRLFVEADLAAGIEAPLERGAGPLSAPRHAAARRRAAAAVQRPRRRMAGDAGRPRQEVGGGRGRRAARARRRPSPTSGSASRRSSARASTISPRRRPSSASSVLQPVLTRHTAVERVNVERLRANAIEAAEQTERLTRARGARSRSISRGCSPDGRTGRRLLMCDETGGGPPIAEALGGARCRGARRAVGDRGRPRGRLRRRRARRPSSHKGCHGSRARSAHPPGRYRGPGGARLLAGAGRRLAPADTASARLIIAHPGLPSDRLRSPPSAWETGNLNIMNQPRARVRIAHAAAPLPALRRPRVTRESTTHVRTTVGRRRADRESAAADRVFRCRQQAPRRLAHGHRAREVRLPQGDAEAARL